MGDYLILGNGENQSGGRGKESNIADAFESLLGAIFLDHGFHIDQKGIHTIFYDRIDSIIDNFDGILIARGDLGLEMELEKVPSLQKKIIKKCNEKCKPVITATQMVESMISNPLPTRAEVNDVAGAVYDGSDAIMLSGETAIGKFPLEAIRMMKSITLNVENEIIEHHGFNHHIRTPNKNNPKKSN